MCASECLSFLEKSETEFDCAKRELQEETGITLDKIDILDNVCITETSKKGNPSVKYWVATLKENVKINKFTFDEKELKSVKWYKINEALKLDNLRTKRKDILLEAYNICNENNETNENN